MKTNWYVIAVVFYMILFWGLIALKAVGIIPISWGLLVLLLVIVSIILTCIGVWLAKERSEP